MTRATAKTPASGNRNARTIRAIFIRRRSRYSFASALRLLDMTAAALRADVEAGEVEAERNTDGSYGFTWSQLAFAALRRWSLRAIVEALDTEVGNPLPDALMPCSVPFYLPSYQVQVLEALARRDGVDVDTFLSDHLLDLCECNAEELADEIPGLREAIRFPDGLGERR